MLKAWSIYLQFHNNQTSKQKELLGFVYVHLLYVSFKLQNDYIGHVSIRYCFLPNTACIK